MGVTAGRRPVVVWIDGSRASRPAATAAARQARRGLHPLRLVRVVPTTSSGQDARDTARRAADELDDAGAALRTEAPAAPVTTAVRAGPPDLVLLDESRSARLLVLPAAPQPDPVATSLIRRAHCPVLVDRPVPPGAAGVVVGVDGGPGTVALLRAATTEACLRGTALLVVHAWRRHREGRADPRFEAAVTEAERALVEQYVTPVREGHPGVPVAVRVVHGEPRRALLAASTTAELVVLGRRAGRGALRADATAAAVAAGAAAPVLVVPLAPTLPARDRSRARRSAVALSS
ncbi:universal stress protein [Geodermatophilus sp. SYSU D01186]